MALHRIGDRYPNYRDVYFEGSDLKGMNIYSADSQQVGSVQDMLINDEDRLKYLVVDLGGAKQVLLSVRSCARTTDENSLYVRDLDSEDISRLPTYDSGVHSADTAAVQVSPMRSVEQSTAVEVSAPVTAFQGTAQETAVEDGAIAQFTAPSPSSVSLYEERLSARKQRVKTGEVRISKRIVTEETTRAVPIKKEKIIIEIESVYGGDTRIDFDDAEVADDGSVRMAIYEERAEVCRQVMPYQNVAIRKSVVEDVVTTRETLRREELVIDEGQAFVDWVDN